MMTKLILVRHGQSQANIDNVFAGNTDAPLTELGIKQAFKSAEFIEKRYKIDCIFASDLKRAYNTGNIIANKLNLEITKSKNLREIYAGKWENLEYETIKNNFSHSFNTWINDIGNAKPDDGESVIELQDRIIAEIKTIATNNKGKNIVISTHATPIRALLCYAKNLPISEMKNIPWVSNVSITEINYNNGKFDIILEGYDKHLKEMSSKFPDNI